MTNDKYPDFVVSKKDRILLMRVPETGIDHMLREADVGSVRQVLGLLKENETVPYVGGGVLRRCLIGGDYNDIDILGVTPDTEGNKKLIELYEKILDAHGKILFGDEAFISELFGEKPRYFGGAIDARIDLRPRTQLVMRKHVDLGLITFNSFMEQYTPAYLGIKR